MSSFLIQYNTMNHFWIRLWYAIKSRLCMTTRDDQLSCWTENKLQSTSQSQTYTKKSWSLFGGLLPIHCWWSTTACWTPVKPSRLRSMLSKLTRCTENYKCLQPAPVNRGARFSAAVPDCPFNNHHFKSGTFRLSFIHCIHLTSGQPLLQASRQCFAGKMFS